MDDCDTRRPVFSSLDKKYKTSDLLKPVLIPQDPGRMVNPRSAEIILYKPWRPKDLFQFEIIINVSVNSVAGYGSTLEVRKKTILSVRGLSGGWAGPLVQWFKWPIWKVGDRGFEPHYGLQV